jgi:protein involved in polysaccharide export with SLBB domain
VAGHNRRLTVIAVALVAAAALGSATGCATGRSRGVETGLQPFTPAELQLREAARDARYRMRVGDTFTIDFKYQDELDQHHVTILPDGRFTMAGLEDVRAVGMTIPQLDSLVTTHFGRDYRNPEVSVIMEQLGKQHVYVLGDVRDPGMHELPWTNHGVPQAIALAGGFLKTAAPGQTLVIRVTEEGYQYRRCDLSHLEKKGLRDLTALDLQPYDVIYVPRSAVGDIAFFTENVLSSLIDLGGLFWDVYAITHIDRVNVITR